MNDLKKRYTTEIVPKLKKEFQLKNVMEVPKLTKVVINCGLGEALTDKKVIEKMSAQMAVITGQKPQVMRAKRAISSFKLRAGDAVGLRTTLRGIRMYDFFQKLTGIAFPRVRDFRGIAGGYRLFRLCRTIPDAGFSLLVPDLLRARAGFRHKPLISCCRGIMVVIRASIRPDRQKGAIPGGRE